MWWLIEPAAPCRARRIAPATRWASGPPPLCGGYRQASIPEFAKVQLGIRFKLDKVPQIPIQVFKDGHRPISGVLGFPHEVDSQG